MQTGNTGVNLILLSKYMKKENMHNTLKVQFFSNYNPGYVFI